MSEEHEQEWPDLAEGESIEIGPDDYLQESEATEIIAATAASLSAAGTLYMAHRARQGGESPSEPSEAETPEIELPPGVDRD